MISLFSLQRPLSDPSPRVTGHDRVSSGIHFRLNKFPRCINVFFLCSANTTEGGAVGLRHVHVRQPGCVRRRLGERPQARQRLLLVCGSAAARALVQRREGEALRGRDRQNRGGEEAFLRACLSAGLSVPSYHITTECWCAARARWNTLKR